jgi:hypothetical protein
LALVLPVALALGGCGGSARTAKPHAHRAAQAPVCAPAASAAVARFLGVGEAGVSARVTTSSQATPECDLRVMEHGGRVVRVATALDSSPQPYFRLERTVVEASQQFSSVKLPFPQHIAHLGLDAAWFPGPGQVMTTDGHRLVTVTVKWPDAPARRRRALAEATAKRFLGPLDPQAAEPGG